MGRVRLVSTSAGVCLLLLAGAWPALGGPVIRTPADPVYTVDLSTGALGRTWRGTQEIAFTNAGDRTLRRVWLRAWANGVRGCAAPSVTVAVVAGGEAGAWRQHCTALPVSLDTPIPPGEVEALSLRIRLEVPLRNDRFGADDDGLVYLGGALPILAIRDDGGWHLDPYVDLGESFYSVVGRYEVTLETPAGLATPATGSVVSTAERGGRVTRTITATDVREFAWAAGRLRTVARTFHGVRVRVWYLASRTSRTVAERALDRAVRAFATFDAPLGRYPYGEVDVVVSAFTTFLGMEYPQIVFSNPDRITISHELAHQWWWGIVGNDEYAEPWLDESLATWSSYLPFSPWRSCDDYRWASGTSRLTNDMGYWSDHPHEYRDVYSGGGCMLASLAGEIGVKGVTRILARHAAAHWLDVARTADFKGVASRIAGRLAPSLDMDAFWTEWRLD